MIMLSHDKLRSSGSSSRAEDQVRDSFVVTKQLAVITCVYVSCCTSFFIAISELKHGFSRGRQPSCGARTRAVFSDVVPRPLLTLQGALQTLHSACSNKLQKSAGRDILQISLGICTFIC